MSGTEGQQLEALRLFRASMEALRVYSEGLVRDLETARENYKALDAQNGHWRARLAGAKVSAEGSDDKGKDAMQTD